MSDTKTKQCVYCHDKLKDGECFYCSPECKTETDRYLEFWNSHREKHFGTGG